MSLPKNNMILIWRIIFTYLGAIFHLDCSHSISKSLKLTNGWYIAVEFFFSIIITPCFPNKHHCM